MDLANKEGGIVVGTGDLSELALGFSTFAGDHIAMYNVNASVPKTLVRRLVAWVAEHHASAAESAVLRAGPRDAGLARARASRRATARSRRRPRTSSGPYELHDFFLFCLLRRGAGPREDALPRRARLRGPLRPRHAPPLAARSSSSASSPQQWKRSVMPDGPKVGSVSLSPRGDWRMPSDATAAAWLRELDEPG